MINTCMKKKTFYKPKKKNVDKLKAFLDKEEILLETKKDGTDHTTR